MKQLLAIESVIRMKLLFGCLIILLPSLVAAQITVPAATAYLEPDQGGARVSAKAGVTHWNDHQTSVVWFGNLKQAGALTAAVNLRLPTGRESKLALVVGDTTRELSFKGEGDSTVRVDFGDFKIGKAGYTKFRLESRNTDANGNPDILSLVLNGPATKDAHFNLKPRRNAASVHLAYPVDRDTKVSAFYCEMTGVEDPVWTYYMACGWHRGYFGMQVNSETERRIIFSVWDSGGEAVDRKKVDSENRVTLIDKGEDVFSGDFGNEGTGRHCHLKFPW